jgi:hypothetical protein
MRSWVAAVVFGVFISSWSGAQTLEKRPATPAEEAPAPAQPATIALTLPVGTPLKVALEKDVRLRKAGQPVSARTVEPLFAFDKLVVPAGSEVTGKVATIAPVTKKRRLLGALNADLSPTRKVTLEFDRLLLPDGHALALRTTVLPDSGGLLELVTAPSKSGSAAHNLIARQFAEARLEVRREWQTARADIKAPGKFHRLERYALRQLPYRPQYLDAGATYDAELEQPLEFGSEMLPPDALREIGTQPPPGSVVHAVLVTPLTSAKNHKGDTVEAVVTQPLFDGTHLVFPEGSRLKGTVLQVRPARRLHRNGLLRVVFHQLVLPNGVAQQVASSLEAVAVPQDEHLALDSEGGARVTTPRIQYLSTALTVALASTSMSDHDPSSNGGSDAGRGAIGGGLGFRGVGMVVGTFARSRAFSSGMAFYGAGLSVYDRFLKRGNDVVYARDMSMVIGMGAPDPVPVASAQHR